LYICRVKLKGESMKELTRAEEQVMQILWRIGKGFVKDIIEKISDPKPAYNTISTIIRILETKGFIGHTAYGKTHEYYPIVLRDEYTKSFFRNFLQSYFGNSFHKFVSFFSNEKELSISEMEDMIKLMQQEITNTKDKENE